MFNDFSNDQDFAKLTGGKTKGELVNVEYGTHSNVDEKSYDQRYYMVERTTVQPSNLVSAADQQELIWKSSKSHNSVYFVDYQSDDSLLSREFLQQSADKQQTDYC